MKLLAHNAATLDRELDWFAEVLNTRLDLYFRSGDNHRDVNDLKPPNLNKDASLYARTIRDYKMGFEERLILILTLAPHIRPQALDLFYLKNTSLERGFTEFGGAKGSQHGGFLPTGETAMFILAGSNLERRFELMNLFDPNHYFRKHNILRLDVDQRYEPLLSGALIISREYLSHLTTGEAYKPDYSITFPAKRITTAFDWDDLVLPGSSTRWPRSKPGSITAIRCCANGNSAKRSSRASAAFSTDGPAPARPSPPR